MAHYLRADLNQLLFPARQRPVLDRLGRRQRPQEIAEIVGKRMKLKPDSVSCERPARQMRPLDRARSFIDPLPGRAAFVVEGDDPLGRARQVGDDEADARPGEILVVPVIRAGKRIAPSPTLAQIREHAAADLARLPEPLARLEMGASYPVTIADALTALAAQADAEARG